MVNVETILKKANGMEQLQNFWQSTKKSQTSCDKKNQQQQNWNGENAMTSLAEEQVT